MLLGGIGLLQAQCKEFAKKKCSVDLKPFKSIANSETAIMNGGDKAEISVVFQSGMDYRIMVCSMESIKVDFKVMDPNKTVFFDSKKDGNFFDFNVTSTQELVIELTCLDEQTLTGESPQGCVTVLTGYKRQ